MGKLLAKLFVIGIIRTLTVLAFAPLLQYFVNHAVNPALLSSLIGTTTLGYWQAVFLGGLATTLSLL